MSRQIWSEAVAWSTSDGTAIANTAAETRVFADITIPANYMADGRVLRIKAFGKLSTTVTPTIQFFLRWGGLTGTLLAMSEAITNGSGVTNAAFELELMIQTRANGSSGSLLVQGSVKVNTSATACVVGVIGVSGFDAPAPVTVDLTADTALTLSAQWSAASASNTLTGLMYHVESLN